MSNGSQSQINIIVELGILEKMILCTLSTLPCCVFLFINGTVLFTLMWKSVFREPSHYILLYNLLVAETILLVQGQLMYIMASCRITSTYLVCGVFTMLASLNTVISPLTLVLMCLERYVAVCYPLRYATIITIRNIEVAIIVNWTVSSLSILTWVLLLLNFPFEDLQNLQMKNFCGKESMLLNPVSDLYDKFTKRVNLFTI